MLPSLIFRRNLRQGPYRATISREVEKFIVTICILLKYPCIAGEKMRAGLESPHDRRCFCTAPPYPYTLRYATVRSRRARPVFYRKISKIKYNNIWILLQYIKKNLYKSQWTKNSSQRPFYNKTKHSLPTI